MAISPGPHGSAGRTGLQLPVPSASKPSVHRSGGTPGAMQAPSISRSPTTHASGPASGLGGSAGAVSSPQPALPARSRAAVKRTARLVEGGHVIGTKYGEREAAPLIHAAAPGRETHRRGGHDGAFHGRTRVRGRRQRPADRHGRRFAHAPRAPRGRAAQLAEPARPVAPGPRRRRSRPPVRSPPPRRAARLRGASVGAGDEL